MHFKQEHVVGAACGSMDRNAKIVRPAQTFTRDALLSPNEGVCLEINTVLRHMETALACAFPDILVAILTDRQPVSGC